MPKAKVRHSVVTYGENRAEVAFRGAVVDFHREDYDRLKAADAVVDPDADLERPGTLLELAVTPTEAELVNYIGNATDAEIERLMVDRPELAPQIENARDHVKRLYEYQNEQLGKAAAAAGKVDTTEADKALGTSAMLEGDSNAQGPSPAAMPEGSEMPAREGEDTPPATAEEGTPDTTAEVEALAAAGDAERFDLIVLNNADEVADYVSDNPGDAAAILEAENRRAERTGKDPRTTVVRAVEAAAGHTA